MIAAIVADCCALISLKKSMLLTSRRDNECFVLFFFYTVVHKLQSLQWLMMYLGTAFISAIILGPLDFGPIEYESLQLFLIVA